MCEFVIKCECSSRGQHVGAGRGHEESRDFDGCRARAASSFLVAGVAIWKGPSARSGIIFNDTCIQPCNAGNRAATPHPWIGALYFFSSSSSAGIGCRCVSLGRAIIPENWRRACSGAAHAKGLECGRMFLFPSHDSGLCKWRWHAESRFCPYPKPI